MCEEVKEGRKRKQKTSSDCCLLLIDKARTKDKTYI
jgi:hypothetical protein